MNTEQGTADKGHYTEERRASYTPAADIDDVPDLGEDDPASSVNDREPAESPEQENGFEVVRSSSGANGHQPAILDQAKPASITSDDKNEQDDFGEYAQAHWNSEEAETPDDTPSVQNSLVSTPPRNTNASPFQAADTSPLASPALSVTGRPRLHSPRQSSLLPFDRRFQAKRSISGTSLLSGQRGSQAHAPGQLTAHSRTSSVSTQALLRERETQVEAPEAPWEVIRWSRLGKLKAEVFSEVGKRKFGKITCLAVTSSIALGTSRGIVLIFDAKQQLKAIIGEGTKAVESGAVTAVAISADHSTVAAGHANGSIFTWEIARSAKPFLQIPPSTLPELKGTTKDGHVAGVAVLHLGFLGVRHTALVSADDRGMAFSHLATRGMGALGRSVKTTRILGRYPDAAISNLKPRKPSSVLAFSPLPMGTAEYGTDAIGLVAMLTPYLLVIVSTTPVAQTQHKVFRAKDVAPHSAMSGCLAWYPAMQKDSQASTSNPEKTAPKLAYCWSNVLTIIEVSEIQPDESDRDEAVELLFAEQHSWRNEEPIVAVQWLSRNILAALTVSQQLIIIEHPPLRATDSSDLLRKHIYHVDLFSSHLGHMVEKLDEEHANMHGVVADAFYMSFKSYKGRIFLLGFDEMSIGTLSNWADRLVATMEHGDYIGAIRLATTYYAGQADVASVGLPLDTLEREAVVGDKLIDLISASIRYAFGRNSESEDRRASTSQLEELLSSCFDSSAILNNSDLLFEDVYTAFSEEDYQSLFLDRLQERVLAGQIQVVPPVVLKALVANFADRDLHDALEEVLCRLVPTTMDIDQVTKLCKGHELFDALFYVWSQGINDYTTILGDLLEALERGQITHDADAAAKIFTYLSYTLTGRAYPIGNFMAESQATKAKADMYAFLFYGSRPSADGSRTKLHNLRQLLHLDSAAFMSMLNEAFEDSFLNGVEERPPDEELGYITDEQKYGLTLNRQYILTILNGFIRPPEFGTDEILFLDMFIARNLPKYSQYIMLPGNIMNKALTELCEYKTPETSDDCQLSAEYLLSVYRPPDLLGLVPMFVEARFYRVIKTIYRSEGQYEKLLQACIDDADNPDGIFDCMSDCLRPGAPLTSEQRTDFRNIMRDNLRTVVSTDIGKAASTIEQYAPDLHDEALEVLGDDSHAVYAYLRTILEPQNIATSGATRHATSHPSFNERYIQLLCDFDPQHVRAFVERLNQGDLRLDVVLPALESGGMIDSAVLLLARDGQVRQGLDRLIDHLSKLASALQGLFEASENAPDSANIAETADDLVTSLDKYAHVGIWLCQRYASNAAGSVNVFVGGTANQKGKSSIGRYPKSEASSLKDELTPVEALWLDLVDAIVQVTRTSGESLFDSEQPKFGSRINVETITDRLRAMVQITFTALLRATTSNTPAPRFLPILRGFLNRASESSPNLTHLRQVLSAVFSAYAFEERILGLSNKLLDNDLFVGVADVNERRRRGWRPLGLACGGCGKKVWGSGAGKDIWQEWQSNHRQESSSQIHKVGQSHYGKEHAQAVSVHEGKGKGKAQEPVGEQASAADDSDDQGTADAAIVFACRHLFHRRCLRNLLGIQGSVDGMEWTCPLDSDIEGSRLSIAA